MEHLYHRFILTTRKMILEARYYREHRAEWEEDKSEQHLFLAGENLKQAEMLLQQRETINERSKRSAAEPEKESRVSETKYE